MLPEAAKERPLIGTVMSFGPGKWDKDTPGQRKPMVVRGGEGDVGRSSQRCTLTHRVSSTGCTSDYRKTFQGFLIAPSPSGQGGR